MDSRSAHESPFLIVYDNDTESIYAVATQSKSIKPWIASYVTHVIAELGYKGIKIAFKSDNARDLVNLRDAVAVARTAPTVPLHAPVRESKANGAMERAVRTWEGQFRTIKSHFETSSSLRTPCSSGALGGRPKLSTDGP